LKRCAFYNIWRNRNALRHGNHSWSEENLLFYLLISNVNSFAEGRNPNTQEVYKSAPKRNEQKINLKIPHT